MFHLYMQEIISNVPEFIFKFWQMLVLSALYHTLNVIQTVPFSNLFAKEKWNYS